MAEPVTSLQETTLRFAADHPTAAGHFPGNPILPGALLLDAIWQAIAGSDRPCAVRQVKFLHIVRPGEALTLRWQAKGAGIVFEAFLAGTDTVAVIGSCA